MKKKGSKIQIPNVEREYVKRTADMLLASFKERVIILNAGAGYGKTQVLAHFVNCSGEKSAWYSLSRTDNDFMSFVQNFTKSVGYALGDNKAGFTASVSLKEDMDILVENLVVWLDRCTSQLNIILDDFQEIDNPDIFNLLDVLIETMSEKLRFFIVEMRSLPDFIERYVHSNTAVCIGAEELRFGQREIEELLGNVVDSGIKVRSAELISFYTEGWPVGVVQIMQQMKRQREKLTLDWIKRVCEELEVSDYFMTRVYKMLPFDIQVFLKKTAVLDYMTAAACNSILGNYQSESMLKYLVREKLFVQSLGEQSGIYRYHSIFQRFLLSQISGQEKREALKRAAYYFLKTEDKIQAAEYGCRGDVAEVVQAVIEVSGEELLAERFFDTLERWFTFLRNKNTPLTPKARFVYGKYLWMAGKRAQAKEQITEAGKAFYNEGRIQDYKKVLLFVAESERKAGNLKQAELCLEQAEKFPEKYWNTLAEAVCSERVRYECCLHRTAGARGAVLKWRGQGITFREGTFLALAEQMLSGKETEPQYIRVEDGFLLQNCILADKLTAAYQESDFEKVQDFAQQIIGNAEYETLHVAVAWKMLAILSWNKKNYRKAIEQAGAGDTFLYKNQIELKDFMGKHRHILEEIGSLHKNAADVRPLLAQKSETPVMAQEEKRIRIQCMKRFRVFLKGQEEVKWRTKKAKELFAYLFHLQGEGVTREELITLLWPESGTKSAAALFHTTLYSIRQTFTQAGWDNLIAYEKKKYSLNMRLVSSDFSEIQSCLQKFRENEEEPERLLKLYSGGYMENTGYLWAYGTAKELEDGYVAVCRRSVARQVEEHRESLAIPYLRRMQEIEPYDEEIVTLLIVCLYKDGRQSEAKQQYDRMVALYKEDLEIDFEKSFQELVHNEGRTE